MNQKGFTPILIVIILTLVLAGGYLIFTNRSVVKQDQTKPSPAPVISQTPQPVSEEDPCSLLECIGECRDGRCVSEATQSANWKTYTNTKYQFLLSYHPKYILEEDTDTEDFYDNLAQLKGASGEMISIMAIHDIDVYQHGSPRLVAERETNDSGFSHTVSETSLGTYKVATAVINTNPKSTQVYIAHPTRNIFIRISNTASDIDYKREFDQILSTFKFINVTVHKS